MSKLIQKLPEKIWPGQGTACLVSGYVTDVEPVKDVTIHAGANVSCSTLLHLATEQIDDCCAAASPRSCLLSGYTLSLIHISEPTRHDSGSRMPSYA